MPTGQEPRQAGAIPPHGSSVLVVVDDVDVLDVDVVDVEVLESDVLDVDVLDVDVLDVSGVEVEVVWPGSSVVVVVVVVGVPSAGGQAVGAGARFAANAPGQSFRTVPPNDAQYRVLPMVSTTTRPPCVASSSVTPTAFAASFTCFPWTMAALRTGVVAWLVVRGAQRRPRQGVTALNR